MLFSELFRHKEQSQDERNSDIYFSKYSFIRNYHIWYDPAEQKAGSIIPTWNPISTLEAQFLVKVKPHLKHNDGGKIAKILKTF